MAFRAGFTRRCSLILCSSGTFLLPGGGFSNQDIGGGSSGGTIDATAALSLCGVTWTPKTKICRAFVAAPSRAPLSAPPPFDVAARSPLGGAASSRASPAQSLLRGALSSRERSPTVAPLGALIVLAGMAMSSRAPARGSSPAHSGTSCPMPRCETRRRVSASSIANSRTKQSQTLSRT